MESGEYPHIIILESVRLEAEGVTTIPVKQPHRRWYEEQSAHHIRYGGMNA